MWELDKPNRHADFTFENTAADRMTLEGSTSTDGRLPRTCGGQTCPIRRSSC